MKAPRHGAYSWSRIKDGAVQAVKLRPITRPGRTTLARFQFAVKGRSSRLWHSVRGFQPADSGGGLKRLWAVSTDMQDSLSAAL